MDTNTSDNFLEEWYKRVQVIQLGHYASAQHYNRLNYFLGIPVIILSTFVGTSVFASLQQQQSGSSSMRILVGLASVLAAVLASLQTFLKLSERAEKHRLAGAKYGALGRELQAFLSPSHKDSNDFTTKIRGQFDTLALESPNVPPRIYNRYKNIVEPRLDASQQQPNNSFNPTPR